MNIQIENTPNPATLKFNLGFTFNSEPFDCENAQSTDKSPLAAKIFGFPWTASVFVGTDFITVTKQDWVDWKILAQPLAGLIHEHVQSGQPVVIKLESTSSDVSENDSETVKSIKRIFENQIRPVVALDGGDIVFVKFEDHKVFVRLKGACAGCPSSQATLKDGIETTLKQALPEVHEVVAI